MELSGRPIAHAQSTLFTVRLWREELSSEPGEVRMQVKHVLSSETRYFREWAQLVVYLEQKLHETKQARPEKGDSPKCEQGEATA